MKTIANKLYVAVDKSVHYAAFTGVDLPEPIHQIHLPVCDELSNLTVRTLQAEVREEAVTDDLA